MAVPTPLPSRRAPAARTALSIHKFGGSALADGRAVLHAARIVAAHADSPLVVVPSALAGVTDALLRIARVATAKPNRGWCEAVATLRDRHLRVADALPPAPATEELRDAIRTSFAELEALAASIHRAGLADPAALDATLARGERLSARILAAAIASHGTPVTVVDASDLVHTDGHHGHALPDLAATASAARVLVAPAIARGEVVVVPGFLGRGHDGAVVTLGRGGSDLTATLLSRVLGATEVVLWKDVPGILTADPRVVRAPRLVRRIDAREAAALAHYGARVIHPRALVPLAEGTRVHVRPFADPAATGTRIGARDRRDRDARRHDDPRGAVRAIAASGDQAVVTIAWRGFLRAPEVSVRAYSALQRAGLGAALSAQAWSDRGASITVPAEVAAAAAAALSAEFAPELVSGEIDAISTRDGVVTVGVVGADVVRDGAVAGAVFATLADAGIEVIASGHAPTDAGLSIVVDASDAPDAQRGLHDALLARRGARRTGGDRQADVVLLGAGAIGRALLTQLTTARRAPVRVCAVIDSSGYLFDPAGLSRARLAALIAHKGARRAIAALPGAVAASADTALSTIAGERLSHPVLVDATAADTGALIERVLGDGWDVVLANKIPLAGNQSSFDRLRDRARTAGNRLLHEATVGAGLPVIDTLHKLIDGGDTVACIEGCPSGTLGFLFAELGRGRPFAEALRRAIDAGLTEPDPRIDLSGVDVARKALILARLIGFRGSLNDVQVESLLPASFTALPLADFLARAGELDEHWRAQVETARTEGKVLRYRARITRRAVTVGLVAVDTDGHLAALHGTDNQFAFTTSRYRDRPLVITGPGAGPAVTAAGVFSDLLQLVSARGATVSAAPSRRAASPRRARAASLPAFELSGPADAPLIVTLGGISASRHVVATTDDPSPGWWESVVGPERAIDTRQFRVLGMDFLDGGRGADGRPARVPSTHDQADALAAALDAIGAPRAHAVIGASYGGMVALAFAERYPERLEQLVVLSAAHESHPMSTGLRAMQRGVVELGLETGRVHDALALARGVAMTTYRTAREFGERFRAPAHHTEVLEVERYLDQCGRRFAAAFPAERFLALSLSADLHRVDPAALRVPTVLVAAEGDTLVPESQLIELAARASAPCQLVHLPTRFGHDAFLTEPIKIGQILDAALRGAALTEVTA